MQDEAHEQGKENSYAMKMIAECNDPKTRYLRAVDTYPQPYIWFYSGTLWEENTLRQLRPKLKMLQN
jgi:hypothetical protein